MTFSRVLFAAVVFLASSARADADTFKRIRADAFKLTLDAPVPNVQVQQVPEQAVPRERPLWKWEQPTAAEWIVHGVAVASIWTDVFVTRSILRRDPSRSETNPLLSRRPSDSELFLLGGVLPTVVLSALWYALPYGWRDMPSLTVAIAEIGNIATMPGL